MNTTQTRLRQGTLALSAATGASALALGLAAAMASAWFVLGFEVVVLATAVIGVLFGRGRFLEAPAMTLALIAGAVGLCSALGYLSTGATGYAVGPVPMKLALAVRLALAALFGLGAVVAAFGLQPTLWRRMIVGAILVVAPTAAVAAVFSGVGEPVLRQIGSLGVAAAAGIATLGFLLWVGLVSAGGHMIITSFERALPAEGR